MSGGAARAPDPRAEPREGLRGGAAGSPPFGPVLAEVDPHRFERELFRRFAEDFEFYAPRALWIRPKEGALRRLRLNSAQRRLHAEIERQLAETGRVRVVVLKGRQQGISTYVQARFFWRVTHRRGVRAFILTHQDEATNNLFGMAQRFWENCPPELRPVLGASNAKELAFARLDSGYRVGTAGTKGVGRSDTIQFFHGCLGLDVPVVCGETGRLRRVGDVEVGDAVLTHTGEAARVSFVSEQVKPVKAVRLKGLQDFPLVATGEHRFWTPDGWRELRDLAPGSLIGFPVRDITDEVVGLPFALPRPERPQGGGTVENVPATVVPSYALGRVVGLYLAEGSIAYQSNIFRRPASVTFTVHERGVARTRAWFDAVSGLFSSVHAARKGDGQGFSITVYGRSFAEWMLGLVGAGDGKRFPCDWTRMGASFVRGLVHGYLAGDGHCARERDRRISVVSVRSALVVGLRDALASLGYGWAGICHREAGERNGRQERGAWILRLTGPGVDVLASELGWEAPPRQRNGAYGTVEVSGGYAWVPIVSVEDAGEQKVRDFEVDHPDHSYCVLHGATHNSEVALWPNAETHIAGALQAVPDADGTEVVLESTSQGPQGVFYDRCMAALRGETDYRLVFIPWFLQQEYRRPVPPDFEPTGEELEYAREHGLDMAQIAWRRAKVRELGGLHVFRREYPATPEEAFRVEAPGALWKRDVIEAGRVASAPPLRRVVVAIDPSGGRGKRNNEVGIIVAGVGFDGHGYVLADGSGKLDPIGWARRAIALYQAEKADRIVGERNFGGDMVEATLRSVDPHVSYKDVVASRGKVVRAEPIAALYQKGVVHHVGMLPALEDEMTTWDPGLSTFSPNRVDALVWALTDLMLTDGTEYDTSMSWVGRLAAGGPFGFLLGGR